MNNQIKKIIKNLPDTPGVYIFKRGVKILYVGKATSLKDRVRSYMSSRVLDTRSPLIAKMLKKFDKIEHIKTDSVLEALVLEASLIKKYQPEANIKEKDNRSFNFVIITKEDFPRILVARGRELLQNKSFSQSTTIYRSRLNLDGLTFNKKLYDISYSFGPFPNGTQLKEALKIVRKMFPYRDKCTPMLQGRTLKQLGQGGHHEQGSTLLELKPCFNRQIRLCPGVCTGEISKEQYAEQIKNIVLFFEGNKKRLLNNLEKQMSECAKKRAFENANITKRTLFSLNHIQDISLIKDDISHGVYVSKTVFDTNFRIESYDIAHLSGTNVVGVMTVVEEGEVKLSDYRKFKIKDNPGINDTKALSEVLSRRLAHIEWRLPDLIVVDGGSSQKRVIEKVLKVNNLQIPVVSVVKDERHRPRQILGDKKWLKDEREIILSNAESHRFAIGFHKQLRRKIL